MSIALHLLLSCDRGLRVPPPDRCEAVALPAGPAHSIVHVLDTDYVGYYLTHADESCAARDGVALLVDQLKQMAHHPGCYALNTWPPIAACPDFSEACWAVFEPSGFRGRVRCGSGEDAFDVDVTSAVDTPRGARVLALHGVWWRSEDPQHLRPLASGRVRAVRAGDATLPRALDPSELERLQGCAREALPGEPTPPFVAPPSAFVELQVVAEGRAEEILTWRLTEEGALSNKTEGVRLRPECASLLWKSWAAAEP